MNKIDWSKAPAGAIDISRNAVGVEYWTNGKQYWSELHKAWCGDTSDWQVIETRPLSDPLGGYHWGVEYHVNGIKPDIADDILVQYTGNDGFTDERPFGEIYWKGDTIKTIRIIDPRYAPTAPPAPAEPDWFDWGKEVAVNWPPEGTECEYYTGEGSNNRYIKLKVMAVRDGIAWLRNVDDGRDAISDDFTDIRPVDYVKTMRERRLLADIKTDAPGITDEMAMLLIKAGWEKRNV